MFERFTERARQVVVLAQEEARTLRHRYIGTEHILLGLLREQEGVAAAVLESLDITVRGVRARVAAIVFAGDEAVTGQIPFTPRAKKVLELSLREALSLGHNHIGTEHILLALVRENEGVAARILLDFDAEPERIRAEVLPRLAARRGAAGPEGEPAWEETWGPSLRWETSRVVWAPEGPALEIPLRLERRAIALLDQADIWRQEPLKRVGHEIRRGTLRITAASLLETVEPRELRRVLDEAVARAHGEAAEARSREAALAQTFLARLREEPDR